MAFISSSRKFKPNVFTLTEHRIRMVMKYVGHCYLQMRNDQKVYDFSKKGKLQKEDFLRNGLVDDYLTKSKNKEYYKNNISDNPNVEIYFQKEENQPYSIDNVLADDYIDISIKENRLSDILSGETGDEIKFAVECKRINTANDYAEYVKDIQKFSDRPFTTYRLPFEGQIGFIEEKGLGHKIVSEGINKKLEANTCIITTDYLFNTGIHEQIDCGYLSKHKRNYAPKKAFIIYHFLLDYSSIVVN
jgi:hypothetical protein